MQEIAVAQADAPAQPFVRPNARWIAGVLFFGASWLVLCRFLSGEWSTNEQYSYGWFVPLFAAYLFWLRWEDRPVAERANRRREVIAVAVVLLALLLPVRVFEVANPDWRPLGWIHASVIVVITLIAVWYVGGADWVRHFAFPIAFILIAVPWISPIERPVVLMLMRGVAAAAAEALSLFGIPAQLEGNLIRVSNGLVGVNEACSGVRSLQTSLMIGLLFGEVKRLGLTSRVLLICSAVATALLANFARAFALVWIAGTRNVEEVGRWHDLAGYVIVGVVFVVTLAFAAALARRRQHSEIAAKRSAAAFPGSARPISPVVFVAGFAWLVAIEIGAELWYRAHEIIARPQPSWTVAWPTSAPGYRELKIDEGVRSTLRFDDGREATWNAPAARALLYFFRWNPGGSSVVRARAHRPDICLPAAGWRQMDDRGVREFHANENLVLPFRAVSFANQSKPLVAHTFFCLHEDRLTNEPRPDLALAAGVQPDWSFPARWQAVRNGVRNLGQQVMEFILVAPAEMSAREADSRFAAMLPQLVRPAR